MMGPNDWMRFYQGETLVSDDGKWELKLTDDVDNRVSLTFRHIYMSVGSWRYVKSSMDWAILIDHEWKVKE